MNIELIRVIISNISKKDPQFKIFGSSSHKYQFSDPITRKEINKVIEPYGDDSLDKSYIQFLTELGNGGAGFGYGILLPSV